MHNNPYVGPRTFKREEADLFFGREHEARELFSLVISSRLVLFYAQSGAGKSSLIQTRLIPQLQDAGRAVLPVGRVSGELPQGIDSVDNLYIFNLLQRLDQSDNDPKRLANLSLTDFLARLASDDGEHYYYDDTLTEDEDGESPVHVLIIDQFEEIVTTHPEHWREREDFFRQLETAMQADPQLWVVLCLREDFVAALDPYAPVLSEHLRHRFYMERMGYDAALEAIQKPAQRHHRPFAPGVAEKLTDNLRQIRTAGSTRTHIGQYLEPVQVQVVCYQLWNSLEKAQSDIITQAGLDAYGDVHTALSGFYADSVAYAARHSGITEFKIRAWVDEQLITEAGTRGMAYRGTHNCADLPNAAVDALEARFLLRAENRSGGVWYELVHDRLVEPVQQNNEDWFESHLHPMQRQAALWEKQGRPESLLLRGWDLREAKAWAGTHGDNLLPPEQELLQRSLKQRRDERVKRWSLVGGLITALLLLSLAGWQWLEAAQQKEKAEHANTLTLKAVGQRTFDYIEQLKELPRTAPLISKVLEDNINLLEELYALIPETQEVLITKGLNLFTMGDIWLNSLGDSKKAFEAYSQAQQIFQQLFHIDPDNLDIQRHLSSSYIKIGIFYRLQEKTEQSLQAHNEAQKLLLKLLKVSPLDIKIQQSLAHNYYWFGYIYDHQGKIVEAYEAYGNAIEIAQKLSDADPDNIELQHRLLARYTGLADVYRKQGSFDEALQIYQKNLEFYKQIAQKSPNDINSQWSLSISYGRLGDLYKKQNKLDDALSAYKNTLQIRQKLVQLDPDNLAIQQAVTRNYGDVASIYLRQENFDKALDAYKNALKISLQAAENFPENIRTQRYVRRYCSHLGDIYFNLKRWKEAQNAYSQGLQYGQTDLYLLFNDTALALVQNDLARFETRLKTVLPLIKPQQQEFTILSFLAWLANPTKDWWLVSQSIEQREDPSEKFSWNFSRMQPAIDRQDEATQRVARLFIEFFQNKIDFDTLQERLKHVNN